jgi:hypothetical protein
MGYKTPAAAPSAQLCPQALPAQPPTRATSRPWHHSSSTKQCKVQQAQSSPGTHLYTGGCPPDAMVEMLACRMCAQKSLCPFAASAATVAMLRASTHCSLGARVLQRSWNAPGMSLKLGVSAKLGPLLEPLLGAGAAAGGPSKASRPLKPSSRSDRPQAPPPLPGPTLLPAAAAAAA